MAKSVDTRFNLNEDTVLSDLLNGTVYLLTAWEAVRQSFPWIIGKLLDAERETLVVYIDVQNNRFNFVTLLEELTWMLHTVGP